MSITRLIRVNDVAPWNREDEKTARIIDKRVATASEELLNFSSDAAVDWYRYAWSARRGMERERHPR
jgi:hypothetical protein